MASDRQRLDALKQGVAPAGDNGFVAIAVKDLQWLLERVEATEELQAPSVIRDQIEGEETE